MIDAIEQYQAHYADFAKTEKVGVARLLLSILHKVTPDKAEEIESYYKYVRILDDITDQSPTIKPTLALLEQEQRAVRDQSDTYLTAEYLTPYLSLRSKPSQHRLRKQIYQMLTSLEHDAKVRDTQQYPTKSDLKRRNFLALWPELAVITFLISGVDPKPTQDTVGLIDTWGHYDNLSDLGEDLPNGLVLVDHEELVINQIQLIPGEILPAESLKRYYHHKRKIIMSQLRQRSKTAFNSGLPFPLAVLSYLYFQSRQIKLLRDLQIDDSAIFRIPSDSTFLANSNT